MIIFEIHLKIEFNSFFRSVTTCKTVKRRTVSQQPLMRAHNTSVHRTHARNGDFFNVSTDAQLCALFFCLDGDLDICIQARVAVTVPVPLSQL